MSRSLVPVRLAHSSTYEHRVHWARLLSLWTGCAHLPSLIIPYPRHVDSSHPSGGKSTDNCPALKEKSASPINSGSMTDVLQKAWIFVSSRVPTASQPWRKLPAKSGTLRLGGPCSPANPLVPQFTRFPLISENIQLGEGSALIAWLQRNVSIHTTLSCSYSWRLPAHAGVSTPQDRPQLWWGLRVRCRKTGFARLSKVLQMGVPSNSGKQTPRMFDPKNTTAPQLYIILCSYSLLKSPKATTSKRSTATCGTQLGIPDVWPGGRTPIWRKNCFCQMGFLCRLQSCQAWIPGMQITGMVGWIKDYQLLAHTQLLAFGLLCEREGPQSNEQMEAAQMHHKLLTDLWLPCEAGSSHLWLWVWCTVWAQQQRVQCIRSVNPASSWAVAQQCSNAVSTHWHHGILQYGRPPLPIWHQQIGPAHPPPYITP